MSTKQYDKYLEDEYNKQVGDDEELYVPNKEFKTVAVQYPRLLINYTFMTFFDCKVGDKAVVFTGGNWNVVSIVEVHDEPQLSGGYAYTWLVQIVDRSEYDRLCIESHEGIPSVASRL